MKALRIAVCFSVIAASFAMIAVSETHAQVAIVSPGAAVVRPAYRPLFPRAWWRRQMRRMTFSPVVPVATAPVAAFPMATTAARVTTFSPVVATAGSCTTCCPTQQCYKVCEPRTTCRYVPQTCFRNEQVQVPVTTMRAFASVDPCTGCTTTCMKPVTTMVCQTRRVPYTTYRLAYSTVNVERTVCRQVMSCSSCAPAVVPTAFTAPVATAAPVMAPAPVAPAPCATCPTASGASHIGQPTPQPTLQAAPAQPQPSESFRPETPQYQDNGGNQQPEAEIKPMKELDAGYQPKLDPPPANLGDKTTQATSVPRLSLVTLPFTRPEAKPVRKLDDSGWHAAGR